MKILKRTFVELNNGSLGHVSTFQKKNGNSYYVFFIEARYAGFREVSADGLRIVAKDGVEPFANYKTFDHIEYV